MSDLRIPSDLLPRDGRFASGPSKIRPEALAALGTRGDIMGTSHRQAGVKALVGRVQALLAELHALPEGHQVVLGNGGATQFWDVATCCLIERRSAHGAFGEFGRKFADAVAAAPFLDEPVVAQAAPGDVAIPEAGEDCDVYAWPQNETSTGVCAPVARPDGAAAGALVLIDATSAAGGMRADLADIDAYYFSPQKNLASDGGLWIAFCSPAALERSARLRTAPGRWVPPTLDLTQAASNAAQHQTLNTPAIATLLLIEAQLAWLLDNGGLDFAVARTTASSGRLYDWAENSPVARPFVASPALRSPVVATIELDAAVVDAKRVSAVLRANGILDVEPYRGVGGNQLRVGCYAAVDPDDVAALVACLDWVIERLAA